MIKPVFLPINRSVSPFHFLVAFGIASGRGQIYDIPLFLRYVALHGMACGIDGAR
jgi:hypothetical protein